MGQFGAPPELIESMATPVANAEEIEILEPNWNAFQIWRRCQPTVISGMGGGGTFGIPTTEIRTVCCALRLRLDEDTLDKVQHMAGIADSLRNG